MIVLQAATPISDTRVLVLGALGAFFALLITQVLPAAIAVLKSGQGPTINVWRIIAGLVVLAIFLSAGAVAARIGDAVEVETAFAYGMAWEALLGGVIKTGKAAFTPPPE